MILMFPIRRCATKPAGNRSHLGTVCDSRVDISPSSRQFSFLVNINSQGLDTILVLTLRGFAFLCIFMSIVRYKLLTLYASP